MLHLDTYATLTGKILLSCDVLNIRVFDSVCLATSLAKRIALI